ncbi:hypothetical protein [Leucobacter sp. wl10]|uniref:hypothetical protein n=1 Tax=Leucobacter sp. wl10 TaxID=2304677 RepID=UPI000E5BFD10|nr:hypothetical protein [Leucobacter sp. wl10]RGE17911.1 hypothetical protein D1J51_15230 [Leucobacter sp. wl10]
MSIVYGEVVLPGLGVVAGPFTRWMPARGSQSGGTVGLRSAPGWAGAALAGDPEPLRDLLLPARLHARLV